MQITKSPQPSQISVRQAYNNNADRVYLKLLKEIHKEGNFEDDSRTGVGTKSLFAREIRFNMNEGFPLLTTKKMFTKAIVYELLWFLGNHLNDPKYAKFQRANAKYLIDNGVYIWVGDLYKAYCKHSNDLTKEEFIEKVQTNDLFAIQHADCGNIYGVQWRDWQVRNGRGEYSIDQIASVIDTLKKNPTDRRIMVSAWNVGDLSWNSMVLPPCHYGFTFYTRRLSIDERIELAQKCIRFNAWDFVIESDEDQHSHNHDVCDMYGIPRRALSLKWNQRSVDSPGGLPFNIASYAFLLNMVAKEVNMVAEELIGSLENVHYYLNQTEAVKEHISRDVLHGLPDLWLNSEKSIFNYEYEDVKIINYSSQEKITIPMSF